MNGFHAELVLIRLEIALTGFEDLIDVDSTLNEVFQVLGHFIAIVGLDLEQGDVSSLRLQMSRIIFGILKTLLACDLFKCLHFFLLLNLL